MNCGDYVWPAIQTHSLITHKTTAYLSRREIWKKDQETVLPQTQIIAEAHAVVSGWSDKRSNKVHTFTYSCF